MVGIFARAGEKIVFFVSGDPWPSVSWEKNGLPVDTSNSRYR